MDMQTEPCGTSLDTIEPGRTTDSTGEALAPSAPARRGSRTSPSLRVFFQPRSVAVIGATERPQHVGRALVSNLLGSSFGGTIYPVNPHRETVLGLRAYPSVRTIP